MIIRIFIALLLLNTLAFVVRAEAGERDVLPTEIFSSDLTELQNHMAGDFHRDRQDALLDVGARLLSWGLSRQPAAGTHAYAYRSVRQDHSVALLNEGASLNLRWKF